MKKKLHMFCKIAYHVFWRANCEPPGPWRAWRINNEQTL